jgi:hypothetical protein
MSDADDNLVLRLLREIPGKRDDQDRAFEGLHSRMTPMERHMEDVKESVTYALGLSAHANVAYETTGQRLDRLKEQVERLEARIETLEKSE